MCLQFRMQGEDFWAYLMASVLRLHFSMQKEDIHELTHGKCHLCAL